MKSNGTDNEKVAALETQCKFILSTAFSIHNNLACAGDHTQPMMPLIYDEVVAVPLGLSIFLN